MTHDMSIVDVRSATGWSLGWAAHCEPCDWWSEPDLIHRAAKALAEHIRDAKREDEGER
jgi:hypothetical protein